MHQISNIPFSIGLWTDFGDEELFLGFLKIIGPFNCENGFLDTSSCNCNFVLSWLSLSVLEGPATDVLVIIVFPFPVVISGSRTFVDLILLEL